jgi:hypothetical protein
MAFVASGVHQCDWALGRQRAQLIELIAALAQLSLEVLAELVPAGLIMGEPLAQLGARRQFLEPVVNGGIRLSDPARQRRSTSTRTPSSADGFS